MVKRANADFSATTRKSLKAQGFVIVSSLALPNKETGSYANGETGYVLIDRACDGEFVRRYSEVLALANRGEDAPRWAQL